MSFKNTLFVAALAFWAGTHYSSRFYEEVEKREELMDDLADEIIEGDGPWTKWANTYAPVAFRTKLQEFYKKNYPRVAEDQPLAQSEADKLYRFAFDKGWKSASEDKQNVAKQYKKFFGDVTAEEVQSEMRGG